MRLVVTEEQRELRDALRRFFADRSPAAEVRRLMGTAEGYDPKVWAQMAEQLGLQGLAIAEEHGGAGFGVRELAVVFEEMGRAVVCAPFLATITAAAALEAGDGGHDLLPGIADGSVIATLAVAEDGGSWDPGDVETTFEDGKLWGRRASSWTATSLILCWWRPGAMAAWGFMPSRMWPPFPGRFCPRSTRRGSWRGSGWTASRRARSAGGTRCCGRSTWRPSCWRPRSSAGPRRRST
ncbi:acyl-CoA dehydrogenase family protein [Actinomadura madurae]|uniref:acyl-CoA dehydrogenase family protein n=1 Tax=Actinomadura madurae TaxID=1993 RepID=UPI0020D23865|nr:acyl-CoA dehydrogenase family protein [Actinomadura madurae]MCQ0014222.1 acyl-CoA dehydrogenase family protein [Actinomadura madurae]